MGRLHKNHHLGSSDMVFTHTTDPAYMAILDLASYDAFFPDWDWPTLTARVAQQMCQERIFAWGCPEYELQVRITTATPSGDFKPVESVSGFIVTSGRLCFTSYDNLTMCAQFEDEHFPGHEDHPFTVEKGRYQIAAHRMFDWQHGYQFPDEIGDGDHYVIVVTPTKPSAPQKRFDCVPWVVL